MQLQLAAQAERPGIVSALSLHQRLGEAQSPSALRCRVRYLVLPEFHLKVPQSPAQGMKWNAVVHLRIQIVGLVVPDNHVAGTPQRSEHRVGKAAVKMAGESDFPGSWFAGKRSRHGMNGNRDGLHASRLAFQQDRLRPRRDTDGTSVRCGLALAASLRCRLPGITVPSLTSGMRSEASDGGCSRLQGARRCRVSPGRRRFPIAPR